MKKILVLSAVVFAAFASQASYLYWQVQYTDASQFVSPEGLKVNTATLYAVYGDDKQEIGWADIDSTNAPAMKDLGYIDLDTLQNASSYSFYIELANYDSGTQAYQSLGVGETLTYTQLENKGFILPTKMQIAPAWTGGTYNVPEPTSGMMILLGLAGLALKRKAAKE